MLNEEQRKGNLKQARRLHETAYELFWNQIEAAPVARFTLFDYGLVNKLNNAPWRPMAGEMVSSELREAINLMNRWILDVDRLHLWLNVLDGFTDENDQWAIRFEFIEPMAHRALQAPSHLRDVLIRIATNAAHQANLSIDSNAKDELPEDKALFKGSYLNRTAAEAQLKKIAVSWAKYQNFEERLFAMCSEAYVLATRDYRNRASHHVPPHFEFGEVQFVTRQIQYAEVVHRNDDGTVSIEEDRSRRVAAYGFGGIPPLKLADSVAQCSAELQQARIAVEAYCEWLNEIVAALGDKSERRVGKLSSTAPHRGQ